MADQIVYEEKLNSLGHSEEVLAHINAAIKHFGVPQHAELPENYLEGCDLIPAEKFEEMTGEAWKEVIPGMWYRG